jgi:hypothetical protein
VFLNDGRGLRDVNHFAFDCAVVVLGLDQQRLGKTKHREVMHNLLTAGVLQESSAVFRLPIGELDAAVKLFKLHYLFLFRYFSFGIHTAHTFFIDRLCEFPVLEFCNVRFLLV